MSSSGPGSGSGSDAGSDNPFVRFKRQVDEQIANGIRATWALSAPRTPAPGPPAAANSTRPADPVAALEASVADGLRQHTVESWLGHSAYSPLNLEHLGQPVPRDAPAETAHDFSFRDAFKDLLVVSAGEPLPALPRRRPGDAIFRPWHTPAHAASSFEHLAPHRTRDFADGFSPAAWAAQLERRGLWTSYFPARAFATDASRIVQHVTSDSMRAELGPAAAERHIQFLIRENSMCEEEKAARFQPFNPWDSFRPLLDTIVGRGWQNSLASLLRGPEEPVSDRQPSREAETSEDLFLNLRSNFATSREEVASPADGALVPAAHQKEASNYSPRKPEDSKTTETIENPDGSKTVTTTERRVSSRSTKEITTTVHYDAQGNVLQRSTSKHYAGGWTFGGRAQGEQYDEEDNARPASQDNSEKQSGWFWTR